MKRRYFCMLFVSGTGLAAQCQTVAITYAPSKENSEVIIHEYFSYDYQSGAACRIDATGHITLLTPDGTGFTGQAGTDHLVPSDSINHNTAILVSSMVMPQLIVTGIDSDPAATVVRETGPRGGPTYAGEYPLGNRLLTADIFPSSSTPSTEKVLFDFDTEGRLVQLRHPATNRETLYDLDPDSTPELSYVKSFADAQWVLDSISIDKNGNPSIFDPDYVVTIARNMAFDDADQKRIAINEQMSTPNGRRIFENIRNKSIPQSISRSFRLPLIFTGIIILAVGSLAWWKQRS